MSEQVKETKTNDEKKGKRTALTVSGYALLIVFLFLLFYHQSLVITHI